MELLLAGKTWNAHDCDADNAKHAIQKILDLENVVDIMVNILYY